MEVTAGVGLFASGLAFGAAMLNLRQKTANDRLDVWWTRAQWAIARSLSTDSATREVGTEAMSAPVCASTVCTTVKIRFGSALAANRRR